MSPTNLQKYFRQQDDDEGGQLWEPEFWVFAFTYFMVHDRVMSKSETINAG